MKHYTLGDRDAIYEAVRKQLGILATAIQKATCQRVADPRIPPSELTEDLLSELLHAGLNAPGFSEQQKWRLWQGLLPFSHRVARMSFLSEGWPWFALSRKPGSDEDVVQVSVPVQDHEKLMSFGCTGTDMSASRSTHGFTTRLG